jgi:micrococcal nuclease
MAEHPGTGGNATPLGQAEAGSAPTVLPVASPSPYAGRTVAQVTRVVDGDTIDVDIRGQTYRVRYIGIDTPETVDPRRPVGCFGREASQRNHELVDGKTVELEKDVSETDDFGRLLRYVWLGQEMVNATLVREGYAVSSTYPPDVRYQDLFLSLQREAQQADRGLWLACVGPPPTPIAAERCDYSDSGRPVIKGNISQTTGEKIYHVPNGAFYDRTAIDEFAGERWFCTEAEAVEAGWRPSKR